MDGLGMMFYSFCYGIRVSNFLLDISGIFFSCGKGNIRVILIFVLIYSKFLLVVRVVVYIWFSFVFFS